MAATLGLSVWWRLGLHGAFRLFHRLSRWQVKEADVVPDLRGDLVIVTRILSGGEADLARYFSCFGRWLLRRKSILIRSVSVVEVDW